MSHAKKEAEIGKTGLPWVWVT